jgi:hypothetical protein
VLLFSSFHLTYSFDVLTRLSTHWSQRVSDDNPRGYNEKQLQMIADAGTLVKKRSLELKVMRGRLICENYLKEPVDDEYGMDCINAMIAAIDAQYAAMGVNVSVAHDVGAGIVGAEGDEDEEMEENDGNHEPQRYER